MNYVNRDNLRHLTGHGRDLATFLDYVCGDWKSNGGEPLSMSTGSLRVWRDNSAGEFCAKYIPDENGLKYETIAGQPAGRHLFLSIFTEQDGRHEVTALPLCMILVNGDDYTRGHQVYQHDFLEDGNGVKIEGGCYTGVTKQGWRPRWRQHVSAAKSGSHYRFHRAIRQWHDAKIVHHTIVAGGLSERAAMDVEEFLIERDSLYPRGLNMVPGGNAGLAYLRKIGALGVSERVAPDDRQNIINRFFERASRKGLSNPLAAANWLNPDYAERVICAGPDRLKPQQIRDARFLSSLGRDAAGIAERVGARNVEQIKRMLSGSTYGRVV